MQDPTRVTNQRALSTSSGSIWLVVGGIFAAICVAVLATLLWRSPPGLALAGAIAVAVLYAAMVVVKLTVRRDRLRLGVLASLMGAIAVVALACVVTVATVEWNLG